MIQWLRNNQTAAIILSVLRIYLGYTWFMAGLGKLTGGFETAGFLNGAIAK
ncbi:Crp/Fnr family transcriptional regulator, partial [Halobacillus sp. BBL2006]